MINIDHVVNALISILSIFTATFLGYWISNIQDRKKTKVKDALIIFKAINQFLNDINDIANKLMSVDRIYSIILNEKEYLKINIDTMNFFEIISFINKQKLYINTSLTENKELVTALHENLAFLTDFHLFINIGKRLDNNAMESILFVDPGLREIYDQIILKLTKYSKNHMKELYIYNYKDELISIIEDLKVKIQKMK